MAKTVIGTVAKIAAKRAISDVAKRSSARARAQSPIPAMAIGLATSFLSKRLLPLKFAGIGGMIIGAIATKILFDRRNEAADEAVSESDQKPAKPARVRKPATKPPATP